MTDVCRFDVKPFSSRLFQRQQTHRSRTKEAAARRIAAKSFAKPRQEKLFLETWGALAGEPAARRSGNFSAIIF